MRINIIHCMFKYSGGGERVALNQARILRERGHNVHLYSPMIRWQNCFPDLLKAEHPDRIVPHLPFPFPFRDASVMVASAVLPFRLHELADCDVLLCHSQPSMWIGYRTNRLFGTPYVGYLHQLTTFINPRPDSTGNWSSEANFMLLDGLLGKFGKPIAKQLDIICHRNASHLLFNSVWTQNCFRSSYGLRGDVCYPGIDTNVHGVDGERRPSIIMTARHYPWKRIDLAFPILRRLHDARIHLYVTGKETALTGSLKEIAANEQVAGNVTFTGFISDKQLQQLYVNSRAYMQTSIHEPFGMAILEAQAFGTPAVVWNDAGPRETVLDGETGFLAEVGNVDDFALKLNMLLEAPDWKRYSRNAQTWATSFDWDSHVDLLESVLEAERK